MKKLYRVSIVVAVALILAGTILLKRNRRTEKVPLAEPAPSFAPVSRPTPVKDLPVKQASADSAKTVFQQIAAGEKPVGRVIRPTGLTVIGRDGRLTDEIVRRTGLSAGERASIDQLLIGTRKQYDTLLGQHAMVSVSSDGKIEVRADPFVDEGRQLYDWLESSIKRILGNEGAAQFMGVAGEGVERAFGNFGASIRTFQIFRAPPDDESTESRIKVMETDAYGTATQFRFTTLKNATALVGQYPTIVDKIPSQALRALEP